jgi:predicted Zn-dependent protease
MKRNFGRYAIFTALIALAIAGAVPAGSTFAETRTETQTNKVEPPVLKAMEAELDRSASVFAKSDPPGYFISYAVTDDQVVEVSGSNGALLSSGENRNRWLDVQIRAGSPALDDTHRAGDRPAGGPNPVTPLPLSDDVPVIRRAIWEATDREYRSAAEALIKIQTSNEVQSQTAEGRAPDFSHEPPHTYYGSVAAIHVDRRPWEERLRRYTAAFSADPAVLNSIGTFTAAAINNYQINSEGTKLEFGQVRYRLELTIQGKATDGMDIERYANFDWVDPSRQPSDAVVTTAIQKMISEVNALQTAPLVDPYAGPVLLTGRAAAVFFHEVFGHRVEGFRQKDINEGQTFTAKIGQSILPEFISIKDDPTAQRLGANVLLGYYPYDDEGVAAQDTTLVDHGVLKTFLMGRSPLVNVPESNGHGRRELGYLPVARQGNLIVTSDRTVSNAKLREMLVDSIKQQGKPFGLLIDDIEGGFTFTGRGQPQAFQVTPLVVYKVFPDGRPDQIVRGVDIVGTPLVSLTKIVATGDTPDIFNGFCGAESGSIPVSAVAPAVLISEMEVQKKQTSTDRPPILPPPAHDPEARNQ